ncbi:hypothetical protein PQR46_28000 [Paraburkholderia sediminicola]|uniref:hypothetical protein n=1 Tax=Paraburkholderia TaxID=1822464 RepID=UPI0038B801B2
MALVQTLATLRARAAQCDSLIANAHKADVAGVPLFPLLDRQQITVAAFLNLFVAWEGFLEDTLIELMSGNATISGAFPVRYVSPPTIDSARLLVIGVHRYFDYANHENVRRMVGMYFERGYPFEPHLSSINSDLADLRTMGNASAHITSTTQAALEGLAQRRLTTPQPGIDLYSLLTSVDPRSTAGNTIFAESREKLLAAAQLIANG